MSKKYTTAKIANIVGVHPNTVRLYERLGLIPLAERLSNGYRVFTKRHIEQFKLAQTALKVEVLQNGLRKMAIEVVKVSASGDFDKAITLADRYLHQLKIETDNADEAIVVTQQLLLGENHLPPNEYLTRKKTADLLDISIDTLRNWEMNGLLTVKRKHNGYRVYDNDDILRLKIIRSLRCANYSLASILRLLNALSYSPNTDIRKIIDTPKNDDDIISVCDRLLSSLKNASFHAENMRMQLQTIKKQFNSNPPL